MVTRGQRRIGRTIRKLENSVEFSAKESRAKTTEQRIKAQVLSQSTADDSPVHSLRSITHQPDTSRDST